METIRINVNKQMDGYTFSILPSMRQLIKSMFPNSHPAEVIFVAYDTKSDFNLYYGELEKVIYPVILGISDQSTLNEKVNEIQFFDTQTGNILHTYKLSA